MSKYQITFPQGHPDSVPTVVRVPFGRRRSLVVRRDALHAVEVNPPDEDDEPGPENLYDLVITVAGYGPVTVENATELEVNTLLRWHAGAGIGAKGRELLEVLP